jgi:hypothetical protein
MASLEHNIGLSPKSILNLGSESKQFTALSFSCWLKRAGFQSTFRFESIYLSSKIYQACHYTPLLHFVLFPIMNQLLIRVLYFFSLFLKLFIHFQKKLYCSRYEFHCYDFRFRNTTKIQYSQVPFSKLLPGIM